MILVCYCHATPATVAMVKILFSTDSTNSTLIAVEYLLLQEFVVEELTDLTIIPSKLDAAVVAGLLDLKVSFYNEVHLPVVCDCISRIGLPSW